MIPHPDLLHELITARHERIRHDVAALRHPRISIVRELSGRALIALGTRLYTTPMQPVFPQTARPITVR